MENQENNIVMDSRKEVIEKEFKRASFDDLIAKAVAKEKGAHEEKEVKVSSMKKTLFFRKPKQSEQIQYIEELSEAKGMKDQIDIFKRMIYDLSLDLQDNNLIKTLEVQYPYKIIDKLFDLADIMEIGTQLQDLFGFNNIQNDIKN